MIQSELRILFKDVSIPGETIRETELSGEVPSHKSNLEKIETGYSIGTIEQMNEPGIEPLFRAGIYEMERAETQSDMGKSNKNESAREKKTKEMKLSDQAKSILPFRNFGQAVIRIVRDHYGMDEKIVFRIYHTSYTRPWLKQRGGHYREKKLQYLGKPGVGKLPFAIRLSEGWVNDLFPPVLLFANEMIASEMESIDDLLEYWIAQVETNVAKALIPYLSIDKTAIIFDNFHRLSDEKQHIWTNQLTRVGSFAVFSRQLDLNIPAVKSIEILGTRPHRIKFYTMKEAIPIEQNNILNYFVRFENMNSDVEYFDAWENGKAIVEFLREGTLPSLIEIAGRVLNQRLKSSKVVGTISGKVVDFLANQSTILFPTQKVFRLQC